MIISIDSSLENFKTLSFRSGLNILLADATDKDANRKTRNSAGKTSFILIVDFLLGANCDPKSLFRSEALLTEYFRGRFKFGNHIVEVERSGNEPSKIFVLLGDDMFGENLRTDSNTSRKYVSNDDWKRILGRELFGIPRNTVQNDIDRRYAPSFRSMIKYFLRLESDGGFQNPIKNSNKQQPFSWQTCLSYMLGLEWRVSREFQEIRDKERTHKSLKKIANDGVLDDVEGSVAKLRPKLLVSEQKAREKREEIENFEVLESYRNLSEEATRYQRSMQEWSRTLISLKETLQFIEKALRSEKPASRMDVRSMYEASGIELPELALRRFEEVKAFQSSIVENRKLHLQTELDQTRRSIELIEDKLASTGEERKRILKSLEGKGAFEDLVEMQRELAKLEADHAILKKRYAAAEVLESEEAKFKVDRIELKRRLLADHNTHGEKLRRAIIRIAGIISALYENRNGSFEVSATDNGPNFEITIDGDRGTGIRNMEVFCLDVALFESVRNFGQGTGFLIHDSHLFDGVDNRQVASAIRIGQAMAGDNGQYIVTMNSDILDSLTFPEDQKIGEYVLETSLSDEGESGGLFGKRFD